MGPGYMDKLHRHGDDRDLGHSAPVPTHGTPGKSTLSGKLHRRAAPGRDESGVAPGAEAEVDRAASSSGAPLPGELQEKFGASLGTDLSSVRVHTGAESASAASAVGAKAYAVGQDIHFGEGQYDPSSQEGIFLIAHEVAHTVQQAGATRTRQHKLEVSTPGDAAEVEADRAAAVMVNPAGGKASVSPVSLTSIGLSRKQTLDENLDEASGKRLDEKQDDYTWGASDIMERDGDGEMTTTVDKNNPILANAKRQGAQAAEMLRMLARELDQIKPAVMAWQAADAAVESLAASSGIDYRSPEMYDTEFNNMHDRMADEATNTDPDLKEMIKHLDAAKNAKVSQAEAMLTGAVADLDGAKVQVESLKTRLAAKKASKELAENQEARAEIDAAITQCVDTIATIGQVAASIHGSIATLTAGAGNVSLPATSGGISVSGTPILPKGMTQAGQGAKAAGDAMGAAGIPGPKDAAKKLLEITLFDADIAKLEANEKAINNRLTSLAAQEVKLEALGISAGLRKAKAEVTRAVTEVEQAKETYLTKLIDAGKVWDRRNRAKDPNKYLSKSNEVSMESLFAMEGVLTKRGTARERFKSVMDNCPHAVPPNGAKIVALALRTDETKLAPDGTLIRGSIDDEDHAQDASGAVVRAQADALRTTASFVEGHYEHYQKNSANDKVTEDNWHAAVKRATTKHI